MKDAIDKAIKFLAEEVTRDDGKLDSNDALKFTQAALNLAHTKATIIDCEKR